MLPVNSHPAYSQLDTFSQLVNSSSQPLSPIPTGIPIPYTTTTTAPADGNRLDCFTTPPIVSSSNAFPTSTEQGIGLHQQQYQSMTSSFPQTNSAMPTVDQHMFSGYNQQQMMPNSFYESFALMPPQMQVNRRQQHQQQMMGMNGMVRQQYQDQAHDAQTQLQQQQQQQDQQQGPSTMVNTFSQSVSRQDSIDYDDDYGGELEEDSSEVMIPKDDIETRLKVAQEAQEAAASEGPNGVFACPYCDKRYNGKHARSIWRRHLQDKHAIPLSQQPRRTRWDGDANRPKNAEERRQRMLESKRRWARKKRQAEKTGVKAEDGFSEVSCSEYGYKEVAIQLPQQQQPPPQHTSKKRLTKTKGPQQQIEFHNILQRRTPPFVEFGSDTTTSTGGGGMLWPTSSDVTFQISRDPNATTSNRSKAFPSSTLSAAHDFSRKGIHMLQPQQNTMAMMSTAASPRKALGQIDINAANGRRLMRQSMDSNAMIESTQQDVKVNMNHYPSQMTMMEMNKMTPMNRFSQIHPTPPSEGDPKMAMKASGLDMKMNGKTAPLDGRKNSMPLLSPPMSHHTGESSPCYFGSTGLNMASLGKKSSSAAAFSPVMARTDSNGQRGPAVNPFSLDRHRISPTSITPRKAGMETLQPPTSASRLTSALDGNDEHKLSPIQDRSKSDATAKDQASPLGKGRKLPPLVKTPLRPVKVEDNPTPSNLDIGGAGFASIRKLRSIGGGLIDPWKALMTPSEEHQDRMLGGSGMTGFTPLNVKTSRYGSARGLASVTRPSRDNGDQFSSPQHLNLTQSLGLAPHSTGKGAFGGIGSIGATPFISSFLTSNSPWPESVLRPSFKTSASKRERDEDGVRGDGSSLRDDDDDDDDNNNEVFIHETPSRPAKHRKSILLGSGNSSCQASQTSRLPSSATRDQQHPVQPINFNLSSNREKKKQDKQQQELSSLDSEMTTGKSSILSTSESPSPSDDDNDVSQEPLSPTMGPTKRLIA